MLQQAAFFSKWEMYEFQEFYFPLSPITVLEGAEGHEY